MRLPGRRDFLKGLTALGAVGVSAGGRQRAQPFRLRSGGEVRRHRQRSRVPANGGRAGADGPHLSTEGRRPVSHRPRSARRRVERQGSPRGRADGPRAGGERRPRRRDRHDAGAGSAVPGVRAGRELRRALAQDEGRRHGTATRRRSASTAARAAATSPSFSRCARAIRATTRSRCRARRTSTRQSRTSRCARRSATRSRDSRTPRR